MDRESWGLDDGIEHLHCGHCGALHELEEVDFKVDQITTNPQGSRRVLCKKCRTEILEWI